MIAPVITDSDKLLLTLEGTGLLSAIEDKPRFPLDKVARETLDRFQQLISGDFANLNQGDHSNLTYCYNMGALLQYHHGQFQRAEDICHREISICRESLERSASVHWVALMLQPYINLGRIAAARGDTDASLKTFESVYRYFHEGADITVGDILLTANLVPQLLESEPKLIELASAAYLIDSIRAYLFAGNYDGLEGFVDRVESLPQYTGGRFERNLVEARARSLFHLNRGPEALELLARYLREHVRSRSDERWRDVGLYCLVTNIYIACGRPDEAGKVLSLVDRYVAMLMELPHHSVALAHTIYYAALTAVNAENYRLALPYARRTLDICQAAEHEVGVIKVLCLLLMIARREPSLITIDARQEYYDRLLMLAESTCYWMEKSLAYYELAMTALVAGRFDTRHEALGLLSRSLQAVQESQAQSLCRKHLLSALAAGAGSLPRVQSENRPILYHPLINELYSRLVTFVQEQTT
jgi:tetratricopeptide (TPR) repeat protein